jgi:hypothetical protein
METGLDNFEVGNLIRQSSGSDLYLYSLILIKKRNRATLLHIYKDGKTWNTNAHLIDSFKRHSYELISKGFTKRV